MWKQLVIAATTGAALLGGGAAALAVDSPSSSPAPTTSPTPTTSTAAPTTAKPGAAKHPAAAAELKKALNRLKNFDHAEWVTGPAGSTTTHEAAKGTVTAVSPSSISAKSADGTVTTFTADSSTKVVLREGGRGSAKKGSLVDVKAGDTVVVTGTKSGSSVKAATVADTGTK